MAALVLLLPCFNEAAALPGLLERIDAVRAGLQPQWHLRVLVVDDGSTDETAELAAGKWGRVDVELVRHERNQGLGAALQTGINCFLTWKGNTGRPADVLAVMDADATHPPEMLPEMLDCITGRAGKAACDVVIASRFCPGGSESGLSIVRKAYSRLASGVMRLLAPVAGARDYTCGYRCYRHETLAKAAERFAVGGLVTERGFTCMAELLVKLGRCGARIGEVPLALHYEDKIGTSKLNVAATIRRYIVLAWQVALNRDWR